MHSFFLSLFFFFFCNFHSFIFPVYHFFNSFLRWTKHLTKCFLLLFLAEIYILQSMLKSNRFCVVDEIKENATKQLMSMTKSGLLKNGIGNSYVRFHLPILKRT